MLSALQVTNLNAAWHRKARRPVSTQSACYLGNMSVRAVDSALSSRSCSASVFPAKCSTWSCIRKRCRLVVSAEAGMNHSQYLAMMDACSSGEGWMGRRSGALEVEVGRLSVLTGGECQDVLSAGCTFPIFPLDPPAFRSQLVNTNPIAKRSQEHPVF